MTQRKSGGNRQGSRGEIKKLIALLQKRDELEMALWEARYAISHQIDVAKAPYVTYRALSDIVTEAGYPLSSQRLFQLRRPGNEQAPRRKRALRAIEDGGHRFRPTRFSHGSARAGCECGADLGDGGTMAICREIHRRHLRDVRDSEIQE
jgi:hypothetical protein